MLDINDLRKRIPFEDSIERDISSTFLFIKTLLDPIDKHCEVFLDIDCHSLILLDLVHSVVDNASLS